MLDDWKTIDTAPLGERIALGWHDEEMGVCLTDGCVFMVKGRRVASELRATHWTELPPAAPLQRHARGEKT